MGQRSVENAMCVLELALICCLLWKLLEKWQMAIWIHSPVYTIYVLGVDAADAQTSWSLPNISADDRGQSLEIIINKLGEK